MHFETNLGGTVNKRNGRGRLRGASPTLAELLVDTKDHSKRSVYDGEKKNTPAHIFFFSKARFCTVGHIAKIIAVFMCTGETTSTIQMQIWIQVQGCLALLHLFCTSVPAVFYC